MVSCFLLLVAVSSTFADFKQKQARTDREENVNNKIRATTTRVTMCGTISGKAPEANRTIPVIQFKLSPQKNKACDCYCHQVLIDLSKKKRNVIDIVI